MSSTAYFFSLIRLCLLSSALAVHAFAWAEQAPNPAPAPAPTPNTLIVEAQRYEHGEGVPKDGSKAAELYCAAALAGYAEGAYKLGWMYANARGGERNDAIATALFQLAAAKGHAYAQRTLERVHADNAYLPACMTPPPPVIVDNDKEDIAAPFPERWLSNDRRVKIVEMARKLGHEFDVDPRLVLAVIGAESGFEETAVSPKNAQGLMQLIPETAERFKVKKILDPQQNMRGGIAYLRWLLAYFQGNVPLVLAAYNAGEGAVERYRGIPPFAETRQYVERIVSLYGRATHRYDAKLTEPSPVVIASKPTLQEAPRMR